jgi:hypothetical protein
MISYAIVSSMVTAMVIPLMSGLSTMIITVAASMGFVH